MLARLVDGSQFQEFKTQFGSTLITGFAHIYGYVLDQDNLGIQPSLLAKTKRGEMAVFTGYCQGSSMNITGFHNNISIT